MSTSRPAVELMFVNIARPQDIKDRKTQRRINSHVMKPIGITRRRARPDDKTEVTFKSLKSLSQNPEVALAVDQEAPVCKLMRELCFALALADDSAMHLALARLEIDPERTGGWASEETASSLTHYNASIEILRNQLGGAQLMAHEAIIGVVVNLACYDTHMSGLQKMIEYRGGIETLSSRYLQVTAIWMDLSGSMVLDQTPHFRTYQVDPSPNLDEAMDSIHRSSRDIKVLLASLLKLSNLAAGKSERELSQDSVLLEELQASVYTTLTLPRYSPDMHQHPLASCLMTYEMFRLAVLLYLSGPVTFLAGNRTFNVVTPHLRGRLLRMYKEHRLGWMGQEHVELFILVVGTLTELGQDRQTLVVELQRIMRVQGLRWNGLVDKLRSMAWVDVVWSAGLDKLHKDLAIL
ncbi:hypothetical protein FPRO05_10769 [Fusarium proliferatum]|uniref:Uncharacterized protein n=1 Tax=Gibberella intermedia TaxID=948311 RepID=A0A365NCC7_GIBIN|nr:hypothetical protein FPRO05_10769 [Fusarium proliferatum]